LLEPAGVRIVVAALSYANAAYVGQRRLERSFGLRQASVQIPIGGRYEGETLAFAHDQKPYGHALDTAGRETRGDLAPQQGADGVADKPVEDASGLLGVDQALVDGPGVLQRFED